MPTFDSGHPSPEPPEEAWLRSEPALLSPASPKPLHFPQPTSIPVLDKMMDVGFNQAEPHMDNAAMHDTELRPGAWRDPAEQSNDDAPSPPFSTGGDVDDPHQNESETQNGNDASRSNETAATTTTTISNNGLSHDANAHVQADTTSDAPSTTTTTHGARPDASSATAEPTQLSNALQSHEMKPAQSQSMSAPDAMNIQALLDQLSGSIAPTAHPTPAHNNHPVDSAHRPSQSDSASSLAASSTGLPPRPPPQDQPVINAAYVPSQHIRDYHPHPHAHAHAHAPAPAVHAHTQANGVGHVGDAQSQNFVPPTNAAPQQAAPGPGGQYPSQRTQLTPSFSASSPVLPHQQFSPVRVNSVVPEESPLVGTEDRPWTADTQRKYDYFVNEERRYVNEARWDQFPSGSRLFVGNLSSEKVTKRDIFHVFHPYGEIAQISIKQAYGFVQFLRVEDCTRALNVEQGRQIRDKRIHLEVSKPQKPPRDKLQNHRRRSRSPAYDDRGRNDRRGRGRDGRDGGRNSYGARSPSPRDYNRRQDDRYRTRSRSPAYGRDFRNWDNGPQRGPDHDDLPLPRRESRDVPDVQIIALEGLERDFLSWVEKAFASRGVRVDVLTISARLDEDAVIKRQVMEGVLAICKLRRVNQDTGKIGLTIFKRGGGSSREVQFEEYDNLDPPICAELVMRERNSLAHPPPSVPHYVTPPALYPAGSYQAQAQYGAAAPVAYQQNYGQPTPYSAPPTNAPPPAFPSGYPPARTDSSQLQDLISSLSTASPQVPGSNSQLGYAPPPQHYPVPHQYQQPPPAASAPRNQPPAGAPPNMADILARLGSYKPQ